MGVLHSFSIKNNFYDKMGLKLFLCACDDMTEQPKNVLSSHHAIISVSRKKQ